MKRFVCFVLAMFVLTIAVIVFAEEDVELGKIVVTPYRTEMEEGSIGSSVEVIDAPASMEKGVYVLKDALNESSSVVSASSGSLGGDTSVFLRGHNSYHTRFMLDGIKIYDPMITSAYYNFTYFNLDGIKRVEISKGPQSALYGSDAIGGVINLISKKGEGKPKFYFTQSAGSYNTYRETLEASGKTGKLGYYVSTTRSDTGGWSVAKIKNNNHERDPYHNLNTSLRLDYDVSNDSKLGLIYHYLYAKYEYDGSSWTPPYLPTDDNDNIGHNYEGILGLDFRQKISEKVDFKLLLSTTRNHRWGWEDSSTDYWYDGRTYQADSQFTVKLTDFYKAVLGFDYLKEVGDSYRVDSGTISDFPKSSSFNKGYFIENILKLPQDILISYSIRTDDHSDFSKEDTSRITASKYFKVSKTKLKASYGEGFKAPSLYQLHAPSTAWGPIGNPNLKPEESSSFEIGLEQGLMDKLNFNLAYFDSKLKNLIDYDYTQGYINLSKARIKGVEFGLDYRLSEKITTRIDYTRLDTENKENHAELARRPENKIGLKLNGVFNKLTANFDLSYIGSRSSDTAGTRLLKAYILGNLSLDYKLKENLNVFLNFENAFNEKYEEIEGYQTQPFSVYSGFKAAF